MKEIKAIIQPFLLDKVLEALHEIPGLPGCTVSEVRGYDRSRGPGEKGPAVGFAERTKLEIVVPDKLVPKVVEAIRKNAHTGNPGDGKVFTIQAVDALAIRTGKRGDEAIVSDRISHKPL